MRAVPDPGSESDERGEESDREPRSSGCAPALRPLHGALLSSARHDLGSPLQTIQGFAELLESQVYGKLSEEQLSFVAHILQGSFDLGAVVDACLELVELEVLGGERQPSEVALESVLRGAVEGAARDVGVALRLSSGGYDEGDCAWLDLAATKRAFGALLLALATGNAGVKHELEAHVERSLGHVRLWVARTSATRAPLLSLRELAARRRTSRSLVWLRLADVLLSTEDASLLVGEQVDQAEVCIRLSSAH